MAEGAVQTEKGREVWVDDDGFQYHFQKAGAGGKRIFPCAENRKTARCLARVHVVNNQAVKTINDHTHVADGRKLEARRVQTVLRTKSLEVEHPRQLLGDPVFAAASQPALPARSRDPSKQRQSEEIDPPSSTR